MTSLPSTTEKAMSGQDFYPPPGQQGTTSVNIAVTGEQNPGQTMPQQKNIPPGQQQNVPPGRQNNMPGGKQTMPEQYMQNNMQPMPHTQYGQQFGQQQMPQQQHNQQQQQYYQQMPQQQCYPQMPNAQPMPGPMMGPNPSPGPMMGLSPSPFISTPLQPWTSGLFDCAQDLENCKSFYCNNRTEKKLIYW
jgi:hypothetical protein